ncbi:hypothetical protein ACOSQ4_019660 [Xanthoceras sorbifolium]
MDPKEILRRCAKLSLTEDDGPIAQIGVDLQEEGMRKLSLSFVGKVLANREVNTEAFKSFVPMVWRTTKEVEDIDAGDSGDCLGKFVRVCVMLNVTKPLRRGLRVRLVEGADEFSVLLCYERLPNFCFYCRCMGHLVGECRDNVKGLGNVADLKFGAWLKAPEQKHPCLFGNRRPDPEANSSFPGYDKGGGDQHTDSVKVDEYLKE